MEKVDYTWDEDEAALFLNWMNKEVTGIPTSLLSQSGFTITPVLFEDFISFINYFLINDEKLVTHEKKKEIMHKKFMAFIRCIREYIILWQNNILESENNDEASTNSNSEYNLEKLSKLGFLVPAHQNVTTKSDISPKIMENVPTFGPNLAPANAIEHMRKARNSIKKVEGKYVVNQPVQAAKAAKAAVKIQSLLRGYLGRKKAGAEAAKKAVAEAAKKAAAEAAEATKVTKKKKRGISMPPFFKKLIGIMPLKKKINSKRK